MGEALSSGGRLTAGDGDLLYFYKNESHCSFTKCKTMDVMQIEMLKIVITSIILGIRATNVLSETRTPLRVMGAHCVWQA